jgi:predicted ATPase
MISIEARHFGPIDNANVILKPLTVFVGQNISGKSYIAQLIYALSQVKSQISEPVQPFSSMYNEVFNATLHKSSFDRNTLNLLSERLPKNLHGISSKSPPRGRVSINMIYYHLKYRMILILT